MKKTLFLSLAAISSLFAANDLASVFKEGKASGRIRYYYMAEDNKKEFEDYYGSLLGSISNLKQHLLGGLKAVSRFTQPITEVITLGYLH